MKAAAIILSAGLSSRMGSFKPLLELGGIPLVEHCVNSFRLAEVEEILLVTGHNAAQLAPHCTRLGLRQVINPDYLEGMYSSIQAGVARLAGDIDCFFILPVDISLVRPSTIRSLLAEQQRQPAELLIPTFADKSGHPPLLARSCIDSILTYSGEGGMRALLHNMAQRRIPVWDRFILRDADTAADFKIFQQNFAGRAIPNEQEAEILLKLLVPERVQGHCLLVGKVARILGASVRKANGSFNPDLLYCAGLLHDVAKGQPDHARAGARQLVNLGLGEVAEAMISHSAMTIADDQPLTEAHLVCLADKMVRGEELIEPQERYSHKLALYSDSEEAVAKIHRRMVEGLRLQQRVEDACECGLLELVTRSPGLSGKL